RRPRIVDEAHFHAPLREQHRELLEIRARLFAARPAKLERAWSGRAQLPVDELRADVDDADRRALVANMLGERFVVAEPVLDGEGDAVVRKELAREIGRASCRERVWGGDGG